MDIASINLLHCSLSFYMLGYIHSGMGMCVPTFDVYAKDTIWFSYLLVLMNACCTGTAKKIRKPKPWKHPQPITKSQLMQLRDEFWDTAPHYGGRKGIAPLVWALLYNLLDWWTMEFGSEIHVMICWCKGVVLSFYMRKRENPSNNTDRTCIWLYSIWVTLRLVHTVFIQIDYMGTRR